MKQHFQTALKVGKPVARQVAREAKTYLASECPLAGQHIVQGLERLGTDNGAQIKDSRHPIELMARAYGL
jgi:glycerol-3-phosphate dehydrogenase subunit C